MNEVSDSDFDALAQEFYSDPTPESLQIFGPQLCECLGLDLSRRSLSVIASWDWHLRTCLSNSRDDAVSYLQIIGVVKCDWESMSLRDQANVSALALDYLAGLLQSAETLEREFASELLTQLGNEDTDSADLIIKAGYLRLLNPQFQPAPPLSNNKLSDIRRFLALNRPWLHLKDDWDTHRISKPGDLFAELARATDHDQAISALLTHSFPLHESFSWAGPQKASATLSDVSAAFLTKFLDPWKNVERLAQFVTAQCDRYYSASDAFMSPYTSIVQTSACGKTRLLIEYASGVPCVYLCLGDRASSCFPVPSTYIREDVTQPVLEQSRAEGQAKIREMLTRLLAVAFVKANEMGWDAKRFIECQNIGTEAPNQLQVSFTKSSELSEAEALKTITQNAPKARGSPTMVLILDEASGLLQHKSGYISAFRIFRRAWADLAKNLINGGIKNFALLTDTTSRVANFSPSTGRDSSYRNVAPEEKPQKLLEPYFMVTNMDVFVEASYPTTLAQAFDIKTIVRKGRPIWHATFQGAKADSLKKVFDLARRKICLGKPSNQLDKWVPDEVCTTAIGILGMRVVLQVHSYGSLAEKLSSSNMRFITGISDSRDAVLTEYPSDPLLSHAASMLFVKRDRFGPAKILRHLLGTLQHNLVSAGNIGELVQQYIYTLARDSVVFKGITLPVLPTEYPTFSVSDFLESLHSESLSNLSGSEEDKEAVLQGRMSFSHFIQLEYTPTKRDLLDLFIRGAAACCKAGQAGVDLIIPILMKPSVDEARQYRGTKAGRGVYENCDALMSADYSRIVDGAFITGGMTNHHPDISAAVAEVGRSRRTEIQQSAEISESNISFLLCQVKNRASVKVGADPKLKPAYCGICESGEKQTQPYLAIRHELRCDDDMGEGSDIMQESPGRVGLVMYRMTSANSPCLKFARADTDPLTEDLLEQVLTVSAPCIKVTEDSSNRLVLALGALPYQFKLSDDSLASYSPPAEAATKKQRLV